ncbi:MAG: GNAT family N-acetyltransferase [Ruminiclostridium sp.]|nr:GNAT family N-acetyltransferase [Ruminiclostridium sp.]
MEITEYFGNADKEHWLEELGKCEWEAGKLLYSLLKNGTAEQFLGNDPKILMMTDGDRLACFCTLAEKDDIPDCELSPWIGFVYTFPEYRGRHLAGELIRYAEKQAAEAGYDTTHISTCHTGLYEKYGYTFSETRKDIQGCDSRIYTKSMKLPKNGSE